MDNSSVFMVDVFGFPLVGRSLPVFTHPLLDIMRLLRGTFSETLGGSFARMIADQPIDCVQFSSTACSLSNSLTEFLLIVLIKFENVV